MYNQGKHEELLAKVKDLQPELSNKYFFKISSLYFTNKQYVELCQIIIKSEIQFNNKSVNILKNLSLEILAEENMEELENLKFVLEKKESNYNTLEDINIDEINRYHRITHYQYMKLILKEYENKFPNILYNLCLCVLQYGDIIKLDLALYDAVKICRKLVYNILTNTLEIRRKCLHIH